MNRFDLSTEKLLQPHFQRDRFRKQKSRVDREDRKIQFRLARDINHHQARALKARADARLLAKEVPGPAENLLRVPILKLSIESLDFSGSEHISSKRQPRRLPAPA